MKIYLVGEDNKPYFSDECGVFFLNRFGDLYESRAWNQEDLAADARDPKDDRVVELPLTGAQLYAAVTETYHDK